MEAIDLTQVPVQEIFPGFKGKMVHSDTMTIAYWDIDQGCDLPEHSHHQEQVVNVTDGQLELIVSGKKHRLTPGKVLVIPSNAVHSGKALTRVSVMDIFSPARDDYRLKDQ